MDIVFYFCALCNKHFIYSIYTLFHYIVQRFGHYCGYLRFINKCIIIIVLVLPVVFWGGNISSVSTCGRKSSIQSLLTSLLIPTDGILTL